MELASCGISIHWVFTKIYQSFMTILSATGYRYLVYTETRHWNGNWPEILYWLNWSMNELSNQRIGVLRNVTLERSSLENTYDYYIVSRFILIKSSHHFTVSYIQCLSEGKFSIRHAPFSKLNSILLNICVHMLTNTVNWCHLSWIKKRCYHPKQSSFGFYYSIQVDKCFRAINQHVLLR